MLLNFNSLISRCISDISVSVMDEWSVALTKIASFDQVSYLADPGVVDSVADWALDSNKKSGNLKYPCTRTGVIQVEPTDLYHMVKIRFDISNTRGYTVMIASDPEVVGPGNLFHVHLFLIVSSTFIGYLHK